MSQKFSVDGLKQDDISLSNEYFIKKHDDEIDINYFLEVDLKYVRQLRRS